MRTAASVVYAPLPRTRTDMFLHSEKRAKEFTDSELTVNKRLVVAIYECLKYPEVQYIRQIQPSTTNVL